MLMANVLSSVKRIKIMAHTKEGGSPLLTPSKKYDMTMAQEKTCGIQPSLGVQVGRGVRQTVESCDGQFREVHTLTIAR